MYETATSKVLGLRTDAARKARVALATALVAVSLVAPPLAAGLVAPPAHASSTFLVTNTNDSGAGSLRQAILDADNTPGFDLITFAIPGTGVHTISPQTDLPPIIDAVSIDGLTQPGSAQNTLSKGTNEKPTIQLDGSGVTGTSQNTGLNVSASSVTVRGLVINRFGGGTGGAGVFVSGSGSNARLEQNFIGTDPTGTQDLGNGTGVVVNGNSTTIGSVVSSGADNLISGNGTGIKINPFSSGDTVSHNLIGTDKTGTKRLGNSGVGLLVEGSSTNSVNSNTVAFNGEDGVRISEATFGSPSHAGQNVISSTSIFANGGLGINLIDPNAIVEAGLTEGKTANDPGDGDAGPNGLQNKPVLSSAKKDASGATTVKGNLNSHAGESYAIEFFKNPKGTDEGKTFLFSRTVSTDGAGNVSFSFKTTKKVALGQTITATARRASTFETSELSAPRTVVSS